MENHADVGTQRRSDIPGRQVSRRQFLKMAGVAGAAVSLSGTMAGMLAACGKDEVTTSTAGVTSTTASATTSATGAASTTSGAATLTSAGAEVGRKIKLGYVTPKTGGLASFGATDEYTIERWREVVKDGVVCGDAKNHPISIIVADSQSDSNRAAQVAGDLISSDGVDIIMCGSAMDTTIPVADTAEALACPCIQNDMPWTPWFFARGGDPAVGFKWTYLFFWGLTRVQDVYFGMWDSLPTNKVTGSLWPNDSIGIASREIWPPLLAKRGYNLVDPGAFNPGTEDFTSVIATFKKEGVQIVFGDVSPPEFLNFYKQSLQQGLRLTTLTGGKALLFPQSLEAMGDQGIGSTSEVIWAPSFPWRSSLTGESCRDYADDFERRTGRQWNQPLLHFQLLEIAVDVLKRTVNVDDKEQIVEALGTTKMDDTINGPIDLTVPVAPGSKRPVKNVYESDVAGGQWIKGAKYPYDLVVVNNTGCPRITVEKEIIPMP